jgi:hypothetical protein
MPVNMDKPHLWGADSSTSVKLYNDWFRDFAPKTFREERDKAGKTVAAAFEATKNLTAMGAVDLRKAPHVLPTLRMSTCPPLARDRLTGLSGADKGVVACLDDGRIPKLPEKELLHQLELVTTTLGGLIDYGVFPWLREQQRQPTPLELEAAKLVVAERLGGARADPIIRNEQEERQLRIARAWLNARGYVAVEKRKGGDPKNMHPGTYAERMPILGGKGKGTKNPVDLVVQPKQLHPSGLPVLIEAKSAGDFTNVNKRRKEESDKHSKLRERHGNEVCYILLLGGYFDVTYLEYVAQAGIDWVWEHRIEELASFGL